MGGRDGRGCGEKWGEGWEKVVEEKWGGGMEEVVEERRRRK